jgi:hypothetical protein
LKGGGGTMPQYAILQSHPANICPMTNKAVREFALKMFDQKAAIAKQLNVKILLELHLDPNHKAFMLLEAPTAEAARDFLVEAGYLHYTENEFHLVTPVDELVKMAENMPTLY